MVATGLVSWRQVPVQEMRNPKPKHIISLSLVCCKTSGIKLIAMKIEVECGEMTTAFDHLNFKWSVRILRCPVVMPTDVLPCIIHTCAARGQLLLGAN